MLANVFVDCNRHKINLILPQCVNPLRAKFLRGNIYLHFMLFLHIVKTQVVEILPQIRQGPTHFTESTSWLLVSWRRKEPGHQQLWYWHSLTEIIRSPHVKFCFWHRHIISAGQWSLHSFVTCITYQLYMTTAKLQSLPCYSVQVTTLIARFMRPTDMGPAWGRQDPGRPHVGHVNLAVWELKLEMSYHLRYW